MNFKEAEHDGGLTNIFILKQCCFIFTPVEKQSVVCKVVILTIKNDSVAQLFQWYDQKNALSVL